MEYDPEYHFFSFSEADRQLLKPVVLFDVLCNNADRKGGHVFFENETHKLFAIDHGICFHEDDKLRTVLWDFSGPKIPNALLTPAQTKPPAARAEPLLKKGPFPRQPRDRRAMPWPPL